MIKTIALSGEGTISLDKTEKFVWLRNMSADDISVSADGEEYATVEAGHSLRLEAPPERVLYFKGSGDVEMYSSDVPESPYRVAGSSGGGGGSAVLGTKNVTENGVYNASSDGYDGYSRVTVNVSASPDVGEKNITANGTYTAADDSLDGYNVVNVDVPVGLTFDYVDGNMGYISMNKFANRDFLIYIPQFPYNIPNGSDVTFEYCLCFDSGRTHPGRYHQVSTGFLLSDDVIDNKYYLNLSFDGGVTWAIDSDYELIEIPQDRDMTLTLRIDTAKTDIFIDGEFYVQTASANSMMLLPHTRENTRFMYGTTSNREVDGKFYAARFYNRALTDAEIMHNHEQDVKLIAFMND